MSDLISRQAAIDILRQMSLVEVMHDVMLIDKAEAMTELMLLPPAQPEPCEDAVSRKTILKFLDDWMSALEDNVHNQSASDLKIIKKDFENLPTAESKRGRWISADAIFGGVPFYCSECGENTRDTVMGKPRWNFCPNCGAKMRGEKDG